jgi:hypothetical protein
MSRSKAKQTRRKAAAAAGPQPSAQSRPQAAPVSLRLFVPALITLVFLLGIFLLPYHVPLKVPSNSQSWEFGFNNTVAQCLIALLLIALFLWQLFFGRPALAGDPVSRVLLEDEAPLAVRPLLCAMGLLQLVTAAILLIWYAILPMTHYGEFTYFIQRVEAVLLGQSPYVDFAFDYGPGMLALPVAIYRLFHGSISVEQAYAATLIIHWTIGFGLLAYIISQLNTRARILIFAIVGFQWINITMGLQYTPLRFTIALASIFAIRHLLRVTEGRPARIPLLALASFLFPLATFALSPEMGVALTVSLVVYFLWFLFEPERRLALLVLSVLASLFATTRLYPAAYFDSIMSFGKGGANFPIFPTVHILAFLGTAIWVFPRLGIIAVREKSPNAPFCAALAFLCGMLILPATGRCDPGHIWINSLAILIVALAAASWLQPKWKYTIWGIYFLVFPVFLEVSLFDNYKDPVEGALGIRHELADVSYDSDNYAHLAPGSPLPPIHYSKLLPMAGLDGLPKVKIGLPLGDNETLERYLKLNGRYIPEYHIDPYGDVFGPADLQVKYHDLLKMQYIFVPTHYLAYLRPVNPTLQAQAQADADSKFLSGLLVFPVDLPSVHMLFDPAADTMRHIATEYALVKQYQSGVLLKRKD